MAEAEIATGASVALALEVTAVLEAQGHKADKHTAAVEAVKVYSATS